MLNISKINNINISSSVQKSPVNTVPSDVIRNSVKKAVINASSENYKAYIPSFGFLRRKKVSDGDIPSAEKKLSVIMSNLDSTSIDTLNKLKARGILEDKSSNDGSSVLDNMYNIVTKDRITGLSNKLILSEVIKALDNPFSITQRFGDIPENVAKEISAEMGKEVPKKAYNVQSSSCVVTSMEFNLAANKPAEFVRFAEGLSGKSYSVDKKIKLSDISKSTSTALYCLREFDTNSKINNWEDVTVKIQPDRNAIVRARVQATYRDPGERSCTDVLIQSALLNLGSQNTYDAITDERTGKFNNDNTGLTEFEKNFVEQIVFETPKVSVVYQNLDEDAKLIGYAGKPEETKQHILNSLKLGQNVIVGYTHLDENNYVHGGHEITIIGYKEDENKKGYFICNDTDDGKDEPVIWEADKLIPLIHHAGIPQEALSSEDKILESWRQVLDMYKQSA